MAKIKMGSTTVNMDISDLSEVETTEQVTAVSKPDFDINEVISQVLAHIPKVEAAVPSVNLDPLHEELQKLHKMMTESTTAHSSSVSDLSKKLAELESRPAQIVKETKVETVKQMTAAPATEVKQITQIKDISGDYKLEVANHLTNHKRRLDSQNTINMALGALTLISLLVHLIK